MYRMTTNGTTSAVLRSVASAAERPSARRRLRSATASYARWHRGHEATPTASSSRASSWRRALVGGADDGDAAFFAQHRVDHRRRRLRRSRSASAALGPFVEDVVARADARSASRAPSASRGRSDSREAAHVLEAQRGEREPGEHQERAEQREALLRELEVAQVDDPRRVEQQACDGQRRETRRPR